MITIGVGLSVTALGLLGLPLAVSKTTLLPWLAIAAASSDNVETDFSGRALRPSPPIFSEHFSDARLNLVAEYARSHF